MQSCHRACHSVTQLRAPCLCFYETFNSLKHFIFNSFNLEILATSDRLTFLLYSLGGMVISPKISVQQNWKLMCCPILVDRVQGRQMHPIRNAARGFHCLLRLLWENVIDLFAIFVNYRGVSNTNSLQALN